MDTLNRENKSVTNIILRQHIAAVLLMLPLLFGMLLVIEPFANRVIIFPIISVLNALLILVAWLLLMSISSNRATKVAVGILCFSPIVCGVIDITLAIIFSGNNMMLSNYFPYITRFLLLLLGLYAYTQILLNNKFTQGKCPIWMGLILAYKGVSFVYLVVQIGIGSDSLNVIFEDLGQTIDVILTIFCNVALMWVYWKMSHSVAFSGHQ